MSKKIFEKDNLSELICFNSMAFPVRDNIEESIKYRFFDNPFSASVENEIIIEEKDNKIVGQLLMMPSEFICNNKVFVAFWGMDYYVDTASRNSFTGVSLALNVKNFKYHFGVGFTKTSSKIFKLLNEKNAGFLSMYIRPNILNSILHKLFRQKTPISNCAGFPVQVEINEGVFKRIANSGEILIKSGFWNPGVIEFIRNEKFINWRFFHYPGKYAVYKYFSDSVSVSGSPVYFVARPVVWKKMNCLLLVDYRFDLNKPDQYNHILKASTKLSKKLKLAATISACSLPGCHMILKRNLFFRFGKQLEILTNFSPETGEYNNNHNEIFVTLADSDSDFYFGNSKW